MDIKEIAIFVGSLIVFVIAGLMLNRAADGDHFKLLKWSITTSIVLLILEY